MLGAQLKGVVRLLFEVIFMKAAVVYAPGDLRIEERPMPKVEQDDDVLIRIRAVGICGSDVHILHGNNPFVTYPRVMGHEMVGEVVECGANARGLSEGDHVVVEPISYGGKSYACGRRMPNVSEDLQVSGVHVDGGMQEYVLAKAAHVYKVDPDVPWTTAVLLEPYTIAGNSTSRGDVGAGDTVLVQGAGPIGITVLRVAKAKGARVMVSDVVDDRLDYALSCGADAVVNPLRQDLIGAVSEWTDGELANVVIDAACLPQTFAASFDVASVAGRIVVLGMGEQTAPIAQKPFMQKQLTVVGSRLQAFQFTPMIRLMEQGVIGDDGLVTHAFPFNQIADAFTLIENHPDKVRKVVLTF